MKERQEGQFGKKKKKKFSKVFLENKQKKNKVRLLSVGAEKREGKQKGDVGGRQERLRGE